MKNHAVTFLDKNGKQIVKNAADFLSLKRWRFYQSWKQEERPIPFGNRPNWQPQNQHEKTPNENPLAISIAAEFDKAHSYTH